MRDMEKEAEILKKRVTEPFASPTEASMRVATILARVLELALDRFVRVHISKRNSPGSEQYWDMFNKLCDSGLKIINGLKAAYNWDETIKKMKAAELMITEMEQAKEISTKESEMAKERIREVAEAAERANLG